MIALVSGREINDLRKVASPPAGALLVGSHGAQLADPHEGDETGIPLTADQRTLLATLESELRAIAEPYPGINVETKPTSVVLHSRRASREHAELATELALSGPGARADVHLTLGKEVVPLRERILALAVEQHDAMLLGLYELVAIKKSEYDAYRAHVEALRDYWIARADLDRAVGARLPHEEK